MIRAYVKEFGGSILGMVVLPDFHKLFQLEMKLRDIRDIRNMIESRPLTCNRIFMPKRFRDKKGSEKMRASIDSRIEAEIEKPFMASGHAFVCFESHATMEHCLREFQNIRAFNAFQLACISLKEKVVACFNRPRARATSTFGKFVDLDKETEFQSANDEDLQIVMSKASEPVDINWINMGGLRGLYLFRRIILNLVLVLILLFLSTPTVTEILNTVFISCLSSFILHSRKWAPLMFFNSNGQRICLMEIS